MAVVQCARGHYFDNEKFVECPHCASPKTNEPESFFERQADTYAAEYIRRNRADAQKADADTEKTVGICQSRSSSLYAAGWLVCIKGEDYGRNFPLYQGFNRIGKLHGGDIVLADPQVSAKEHCSVVYEEKKNLFFVVSKDGNFVSVDGKDACGALEIKNGQVISIGETQLELVVFCTGEKRWIKK